MIFEAIYPKKAKTFYMTVLQTILTCYNNIHLQKIKKKLEERSKKGKNNKRS